MSECVREFLLEHKAPQYRMDEICKWYQTMQQAWDGYYDTVWLATLPGVLDDNTLESFANYCIGLVLCGIQKIDVQAGETPLMRAKRASKYSDMRSFHVQGNTIVESARASEEALKKQRAWLKQHAHPNFETTKETVMDNTPIQEFTAGKEYRTRGGTKAELYRTEGTNNGLMIGAYEKEGVWVQGEWDKNGNFWQPLYQHLDIVYAWEAPEIHWDRIPEIVKEVFISAKDGIFISKRGRGHVIRVFGSKEIEEWAFPNYKDYDGMFFTRPEKD